MADFWERKIRARQQVVEPRLWLSRNPDVGHAELHAEFHLETEAEVRPHSRFETLRLASMVEGSIVDGPGMRFVIFAQGCPHRCVGCHNPQTHLSVGGQAMTVERVLAAYDRQTACRGVTLSGGEPFMQAGLFAQIADAVHQRRGDVITYTGYRLESLRERAKTDSGVKDLLDKTDLLIDGQFVLAKRCLELPFVGSLNQRLISLSMSGDQLLEDIPTPESCPAIERVLTAD